MRYSLIAAAALMLGGCGAEVEQSAAQQVVQTKQKNSNSQSRTATIAFYNVENLFDTKDDPKTNDESFTPTGSYRYTDKVYKQKLNNIANAIATMEGKDQPDGPAIIGLAEIENNTVLKDLTKQNAIKGRGYKYVWYNSPDNRGIDVAMLYNPKQFKVISSKALPIRFSGKDKYDKTRDVLYVHGVLMGDTVHVLVNHWPSRAEGQRRSEPKRVAAAQVNKDKVDELLRENINANIIIMGDLNDNPDDISVTQTLRAYDNASIEKKGFLYDPFAQLYKSGKGTSVYHRQWDMFDQIIISDGMLQDDGWKFKKAKVHDVKLLKDTYRGVEGYPYRSFKGTHWIKGYSDHFPVLLYLSR